MELFLSFLQRGDFISAVRRVFTRTVRESIERVDFPLLEPVYDGQHPLPLIRMVVDVYHHRLQAPHHSGVVTREFEQRLGVHELINVHHPSADVRIFVRPVRREEHHLVVHRLVPLLSVETDRLKASRGEAAWAILVFKDMFWGQRLRVRWNGKRKKKTAAHTHTREHAHKKNMNKTDLNWIFIHRPSLIYAIRTPFPPSHARAIRVNQETNQTKPIGPPKAPKSHKQPILSCSLLSGPYLCSLQPRRDLIHERHRPRRGPHEEQPAVHHEDSHRLRIPRPPREVGSYAVLTFFISGSAHFLTPCSLFVFA